MPRSNGFDAQTRRELLLTGTALVAGAIAGCREEPASLVPAGGADAATAPDAAAGADAATHTDAATDGGAGSDSGPTAEADARAPDAQEQLREDAAANDSGQRDAGLATDPELIPESNEFPLGVASGDVQADGAVLWTRYSGSRPLELAVFEVDAARVLHEVRALLVTPASGGFVHATVGGLSPGARHRYAFFALDGTRRAERSPIGTFRTALAANALEPLVFAATSCTSDLLQYGTLEHAGSREDIAAFLLLGDTSYNDGARSLSEYRNKWAATFEKVGYRAMKASTSVLATWDDHEVENDFDPERIAPAQLMAARAAFFENLPLRRIPGAEDRIWRSFRWGTTAEIFVLDGRGERKRSTLSTPETAEYLSRAQMDWFKDALARSPCVFKLVMNSMPITDWPAAILEIEKRWTSYTGQRTEILGHIDTTPIPGVVWIAGDFHFGSIGRIATSGLGSSSLEILAGPGAQIPNLIYRVCRPPQFDFATGDSNYVAFHLDPATREVRVVFHDRTGAVLTDRRYTV